MRPGSGPEISAGPKKQLPTAEPAPSKQAQQDFAMCPGSGANAKAMRASYFEVLLGMQNTFDIKILTTLFTASRASMELLTAHIGTPLSRKYMSHSLNSLKGIIWGNIMGSIKGNARS